MGEPYHYSLSNYFAFFFTQSLISIISFILCF
ncbi:hypothetical protein CsSME_00042813 [Camellia sinensis var. sinensis]